MAVRGIRGAVSTGENTAEEISRATQELLAEMVRQNKFLPEDIAGVFFTMTKDLNADFPAKAARKMGWVRVPMICQTEVEVPGSLTGIIRVLVQINTVKKSKEINHVYLGRAKELRPDWSSGE